MTVSDSIAETAGARLRDLDSQGGNRIVADTMRECNYGRMEGHQRTMMNLWEAAVDDRRVKLDLSHPRSRGSPVEKE